MARIRTIKPEFFTSLTTAELTLAARLTFIGLWTHCDDEGRCIYDVRLIRAALWPLDDRTFADLEEDLRALTECSLISSYEVGKRRYLVVNGWAEHQRINRPSPSKYPAPGTPPTPPLTRENGRGPGVLTEDSVSVHGGLTSGKERNREQGKERNREKDTRSAVVEKSSVALVLVAPSAPCLAPPPTFNEFWAVYPRRVGKPKASAAFVAACRRAPPSFIIEGALRYLYDPNRLDEFTAHPTTWLNRDGWDDPPLPIRNSQTLEPKGFAGLREFAAVHAAEIAAEQRAHA